MNILLLKQIFAGIFVSIACRNRPFDFLSAVTNLPNSAALHSHSDSAVLYLRVIGGTNFWFIDE